MKTRIGIMQHLSTVLAKDVLRARLRHVLLRIADVHWYQVAVVATATFAISLDLMFPPVRVAIGNGLDVYAGHNFHLLPASDAVTVDFTLLAVELLMIVVAAVAGWRIGTREDDESDVKGDTMPFFDDGQTEVLK